MNVRLQYFKTLGRLAAVMVFCIALGGSSFNSFDVFAQSPTDNCNPAIHCPENPVNCFNPDQRDSGGIIGRGDACDNTCSGDLDRDEICNEFDLCPTVFDQFNEDSDGDGYGDVCDPCTDLDRDGFWDIDLSANDPRVCPQDNCPASVTFLSTDRYSYCSLDKLTRCTNVGGNCPAGKGVCTQYDSYNPYQEDFDNDLVGYICDACIDFDKDGFGDWAFYKNSIPGITLEDPYASSQAIVNDTGLKRYEHFRGCQTPNNAFWGFNPPPNTDPANSTNLIDLDNCPGGPNGANCVDEFGISISCYNPAGLAWDDYTRGNHPAYTQVDYNRDNRGDICDGYGFRCGDKLPDFAQGETCDCGNLSSYTGPHTPFGQTWQCTSANDFACIPAYHPTIQQECNWCAGCGIINTEYGGVCGDGVRDTGSPEACDQGTTANPGPDGLDGVYNGTVCTPVHNSGQGCSWCTVGCTTSFVPATSCGDGIINGPSGQEQCDDGSSGPLPNNGVSCSPPAGGTCEYCDTLCHEQTLVGPCVVHSDCDSGDVCIAGTCETPECTIDSHCDSFEGEVGYYCNTATFTCEVGCRDAQHCVDTTGVGAAENYECTAERTCDLNTTWCNQNVFNSAVCVVLRGLLLVLTVLVAAGFLVITFAG